MDLFGGVHYALAGLETLSSSIRPFLLFTLPSLSILSNRHTLGSATARSTYCGLALLRLARRCFPAPVPLLDSLPLLPLPSLIPSPTGRGLVPLTSGSLCCWRCSSSIPGSSPVWVRISGMRPSGLRAERMPGCASGERARSDCWWGARAAGSGGEEKSL